LSAVPAKKLPCFAFDLCSLAPRSQKQNLHVILIEFDPKIAGDVSGSRHLFWCKKVSRLKPIEYRPKCFDPDPASAYSSSGWESKKSASRAASSGKSFAGRRELSSSEKDVLEKLLPLEELSLLLGGIDLTRTRRKDWYRKELELGEKM
jgi:hypothetical protein